MRKRFVRLPEGGTGFEELIPESSSPSKPEGQYVMETCEPGESHSKSAIGMRGLMTSVRRLGDLVLIHGSVLHKSSRNTSPNTRFAYTFHMIESEPHAKYDEKNWLQPTRDMPFSKILEVA